MANLQLETLFSDEKLLFQKDHCHLEQLIMLLRLEGKCSAEYRFDFAGSGIPPPLRRISQPIFPQRGSDTSFHPRDTVKDVGVLSQR